MTEKYESGALHPSEVLEMYKCLDIVDKERFIEMLENEEGGSGMILTLDKASDWLYEHTNSYIYSDDSDNEPYLDVDFVKHFREAMTR